MNTCDRKWHTITATLAVVPLILLTSACGGSSDSPQGAGTSKPATTKEHSTQAASGVGSNVSTMAREQLPDDIRSAGVLKMATSTTWPPFAFVKGNQPAGIDVGLMKAVARRLGLEPELTNVKFSAIISGVQTGRFDISANGMADSKQRRKKVNFVDYFKATNSLLVPKSSDTSIAAHNLCGHNIAVTQGSNQQKVVKGLSKNCVTKGKQPIDIDTYPETAETILAVSNNRSEAFVTSTAVGDYITDQTHKDLKVLPKLLDTPTLKIGIIVAKDRPKLAKAVKTALNSLIKDGTYSEILRSNFADPKKSGVSKATINSGHGLN